MAVGAKIAGGLKRLIKKYPREVAVGGVALAGAATFLYASKVAVKRFRVEHVSVAVPHDTTISSEEFAQVSKVSADCNSSMALGQTVGTVIGASGPDGTAVPRIGAVRHAVGNLLRTIRILHLSDLHLSHSEGQKMAFIEKVAQEDYDMVILTGDIFEDYTGLAYASSLLPRQPRLGAYAVLGNHDYFSYSMFHKTFGRLIRRYRHPATKRDVTPLIAALEATGFTVLRNDAHQLTDEGIHIVGVDYPGISEHRIMRLVEGVPDHFLKLALFHMPRNLKFYSRAGIHIAFGGHTHGGQVRVPGVGALITDSELPRHKASGVVKHGNSLLHISRGLGADPRSNFRLFCPPAATIVEVRHFG